MEDLWSKYDKIKEVFYRDFVYETSYTEQASCIPLSSVKDGAGWVGDGTINLAQHLQFLYTEMVKVKVKRGANNWYFSGGFRWAFKKFGGECSTFWHCLWYKPFIFLADRVYHPYICKWFGIKVKNNSYYCLGSTNEKSWYGPKFRKRLVSKFNKSLEGGELFMPHLVFLHGCEGVDGSSLESYLNEWEWDGVNSPIEFLTLCNWYKIIF